MGGRYSRIKTLSIHEQAAFMRQLWPSFGCKIRSGRLVCRGLVRPDALCSEYRVRIEYRVGWRPRVFVEDPALTERSDDEPVPHVYGPDEPCLFVPGSGEWQGDKVIAQTIVGWLSEWLVFYETWHATGEWLGGGVHPPRRKDPRPKEISHEGGRQG